MFKGTSFIRPITKLVMALAFGLLMDQVKTSFKFKKTNSTNYLKGKVVTNTDMQILSVDSFFIHRNP
jgi:hypothetical protein